MPDIEYVPPPTIRDFMLSEAFFRIIAGPVGSGKTTGVMMEMLRRSFEQAPAPDGLRYTRFAIVRTTLKQLRDTVLKDITQWLLPIVTFKVTDNTVYIDVNNVRSEWLLIPLENQEDQKRLLSMQLTGAWLSEAIEIPLSLTEPLAGRCGRYPGANLGGASWFGMLADTNMPTLGSEWADYMMTPPPTTDVFCQPSGLSDEAENLQWLMQTPETLKLPEYDARRLAQGKTYYERLAASPLGDAWIARYVRAEYGEDPSGLAVHRETFVYAFHVLEKLDPIGQAPLIIGQDFGRNPCSIILQVDAKGKVRVLGEAIAEDISLELHIQKTLRPLLNTARYAGLPVVMVGDPSGVAKDSLYEETSFDLLKRMGFVAYPAPTNDIDARLRAVDSLLLQQREGGPAIVFSSEHCPVLVRGMMGGYRYAKTKSGQTKPLPDKSNQYSHPADALQYGCMAVHGGLITRVTQLMARGPRVHKRGIPAGAWT
jgi:hypothetical protein